MHVSLDGFVAGPKGEMNWIQVNEEIFEHVGRRIANTDTALYGRHTFQMMENYWPTAGDKPDASQHDKEHSKWYSQSKKIVLSKTLEKPTSTQTILIRDRISESILRIKENKGSEILVFGSPTATHSLMEFNLIDGFWLFVNPVILGKGIPLFSRIQEKIQLKRMNSKAFSGGVTELDFLVDHHS